MSSDITQLISEIAKRYELPNLKFVRQIDTGVMSENYVLKNDDQSFFFKTYHAKHTPEAIAKVHEVKLFFANHNIPVVLPIPDMNGDTFFEADGRLHVLFPFIEGKIFYEGQLPNKALESAGEMLARIHLAGSHNFPSGVREKKTLWDDIQTTKILNEILTVATSKPKPDQFDYQTIQYIRQLLEFIEKSDDHNGAKYHIKNDHLIHGDYKYNNLFFDDKSEIKYVFDWEQTRTGDRRDEILRFLNLSVFGGVFDDERFDQAAIFLTAYNQLYPITREKLTDAINWYELNTIRGVWTIKEHYLLNNTKPSRFMPQHIATFDYMTQHLDEFCERLVAAIE